MTTKFYALLTNQGAAKLANATALGTKIQITEMAVGDGGGTLPTPDASQTKLIGEKRRAALNSLSVDAVNSSQIIAEQVIPENEGGFWIREIGLFDADGDMVAVANCAETYKPQLQEGSGRTQTVRMILIVNSAATVTLKIDPSVVLATRKYVDDKAIEVRAYADEVMKTHLAQKNPHAQYLQIASALAEIKDAGLVADVLKNLGLGEAAKLPAASAATSGSGWLSVPVVISGTVRNIILQWKSVTVPQSIDGTMVVVNSSWPVAFPAACLSIIQALTNSTIYATNGNPYTSSAIVDRATFAAASSYSKSPSTVTVWGIGW